MNAAIYVFSIFFYIKTSTFMKLQFYEKNIKHDHMTFFIKKICPQKHDCMRVVLFNL